MNLLNKSEQKIITRELDDIVKLDNKYMKIKKGIDETILRLQQTIDRCNNEIKVLENILENIQAIRNDESSKLKLESLLLSS